MVEQFCHSILQLEIQSGKPLANLVMGLASQCFARSVAEASLSPCDHYQHSSSNKAIAALFKGANFEGLDRQGIAEEKLAAEKKYARQDAPVGQAIRAVLAAEHGH